MINIVNIIFFHTLILLIWFKTDAFVVYSKLLKLDEFFYIKKWEEFKKTKDCPVTYHQFLRMNCPDGFFTKLVTCPICFSVWLCIIPTIFMGFYLIPIICTSSILLYFLIVKLMS